MGMFERSAVLESLQSLDRLRELAQKNTNGIVTCHLNGTGLWDVMWNIDNKDGSADDLSDEEMLDQLERMSTPVKE